jgi:hypothetical protein
MVLTGAEDVRSQKTEARSKKQEEDAPVRVIFFCLLTIDSEPFWLLTDVSEPFWLLASDAGQSSVFWSFATGAPATGGFLNHCASAT